MAVGITDSYMERTLSVPGLLQNSSEQVGKGYWLIQMSFIHVNPHSPSLLIRRYTISPNHAMNFFYHWCSVQKYCAAQH